MGLFDRPLRAFVRSRRYLVLQRDLTEPLTGTAAAGAVSFRAASAADISERVAADLDYGGEWKSAAVKSLAGGNICAIGEEGGRIVYAGWLSFDTVTVPPRSFQIGPGWAYFHDVRMTEAHNTPALRSAGLSYRVGLAAERGARNGLGLVYSEDSTGLQTMLSAGFVDTGDIKRSRILLRWRRDQYPAGFEEHLLQGCAAETIAAVKAGHSRGHRLVHN